MTGGGVGRRTLDADGPGAFDDRPAGKAEREGDDVPGRAFGAKTADLGILSCRPDCFPGIGGSSVNRK